MRVIGVWMSGWLTLKVINTFLLFTDSLCLGSWCLGYP